MRPDALLLDLYACPAQPERWAPVLDRLCEETGAVSAVVQAFRFDREFGRVVWQATDRRTARLPTPPMVTSANPRMARHRMQRSLRALGRVGTDDDLFETGDPEREALQQQLATIGIGGFMGVLQQLEGDTFLAVALHCEAGTQRGFGAAAGSWLEAFAPHVRQAVQLAGQLHRRERDLAHLEGHLDGLRCGLLLCSTDARVRWMNRSARTLTDGTRELLVHGGVLRARQPAATRALQDEIALAGPAPRFVAVGEGPQALHVALRAHRCGEGADADAGVLLALTRGADAASVPQEAWCRLLGVTRAEAALVATLAAGGTVEQHAVQRGVSAGTVRGQLKQVLAKTGTHRQADLVRLALGSSASHLLDSLA
jgi:DNA-binding CsgD family transcriptional regulator/PAS domain-containing protein